VRKFLPLGLVLLFPWLPTTGAAQTQTVQSSPSSNAQPGPRPTQDELARRLSAAQTYQLSGDLERAAVENRAVTAIALARLGAIAIRERQFPVAVRLLTESVAVRDDSATRTDLAIAHMRLLEVDMAQAHARLALDLDEKNARAHHVLGKLFYMKGEYAGALPRLERAVMLEPDLDAAYTLGMTYLRLKQIERTKLLFEEIQAALKNSAPAHLLFGRAYEETGFSDEAEREFKKALAIDDKAPRAHFYLGYVILQHGGSERLPQAREEFERELQLDPQSVYSNFFLGVLAATANDHKKAINYLLETTRLNPLFGEAHLHLGQSQAEVGDPGAEKSLRRSIELTTDVSHNNYQIKKAHYILGRLLLKAGRQAEAEKELAIAKALQAKSLETSRQELGDILGQVIKPREEVTAPSQVATAVPNGPEDSKDIGKGSKDDVLLIEESPPDTQQAAKFRRVKEELIEILAQAFHNLGVGAAQQGQLTLSLEQFAKAAEWKADLAGLDRNWGIVSFRAGQYESAIPLFSRQLKAHPDDALIRRMLGVSHYLNKNFPQVVETLKPLEPKIVTDAELAYIYGLSLMQLSEHKRAGILFQRLAAQSPKDALTRFYAAQGFVMLQDYQLALQEFRLAAELDPKMLQVHYNAGQTLIRLNQLADAEREFRAELLLSPADVTAKYHLAYVLLERKQDIPNALTLLRETVADRPQYGDAQYLLGKTLIGLGDLNEGIEHLEMAARAEPSKDYIHYQLSIAYRRASRITEAERSLELYRTLKASNRNRALPENGGAKPNVP
jgi:tetratricopeptide (TPR) repeat protein